MDCSYYAVTYAVRKENNDNNDVVNYTNMTFLYILTVISRRILFRLNWRRQYHRG